MGWLMRAVRWLAVSPGTRGRGMAGNGAAHLVTMMPMMVMMLMMLVLPVLMMSTIVFATLVVTQC